MDFHPQPKPAKGALWKARKDRRKDVVAAEETAKRAVRLRDHGCRWPHCANCKAYKPRLEVAHVDPKGMGGDHGVRSDASMLILLDFLTHQGADGLERHGRKIEPLTAAGTNGPCSFWVKDETGGWTLVAEEVAIGIYRRD